MKSKISDIINKIKQILKPIVKKLRKIKADYYLKKVCAKTKAGDIIKIGFIVQMPSIWDKQIKIYEEAQKRDGIETYLFVVPEDDWSSQVVTNGYKNNFFVQEYPEAIKIHDENGKIINLFDYNLDYLFYPRPYDMHLPKEVQSRKMYKRIKCCYVPYGFTGADVFNSGNVYNEFFNYMYFCFMDSSYMKKLLEAEYVTAIKKKIKRIEYLGYPSLETYLNMGDTLSSNRITWTPRWSYDEKYGGSNFLEYKDSFVEMIKNTRCECVFRPHPLMFVELVEKGLITEKERYDYVEKLQENQVLFDVSSPIDAILQNTDVLISDFSSIVGTFFMTARPIIYCEKGIELNEVFQEFKKYMYVAYDWEGVKKYCNMIVVQGNDYLKEKRKKFIAEKYGIECNAAKKIVDTLIQDMEKG